MAILDDYGNKLLREEFYMAGLNCSPLSFDKECQMTNKKFNKNPKKKILKALIISSALIRKM